MTGTEKPGSVRTRLPELLLTLLVLAGFANCVYFFHENGRLPQPFIFDVNDTFMDWFNTAYWAHHSGAFTVWRTVYPPLSFVFLKIFGFSACYGSDPFAARDCDFLGIWTILGTYVVAAALAYLAFRRNDPKTAILRGLAFALGLPMLFTLERGNLILPCFVFFVLAHGGLVQSKWLRSLSIAMTINFKPYLLLPALTLAFKRKWRLLELAGIASIFVYLLTFAVIGSGSPTEMISNTINWVKFTSGLIWEQIYYSTSYAPFLEFDTPRFPTRDVFPSQILEPMLFGIPILIRTSQLFSLLCLAGAWLQPKALSTARISALLLATSLIGQSPGGYTETFLVFLLFLERWERPGQIVALIAGYLLCVPYDYVFSNILTLSADSWLSGRSVQAPFGISAGVFIRPGLVVVMLWGLALDSLALIVRAHRDNAPTLDLLPHGMKAQAL